ncbi:MAG: hypothetical protein A2W25_05200 [candidate division Zixibacteria bacterium RBG_16_53_22]|nr:MAG: hypothetical protein A2W25_05200 [candidate division Zixibacteria bacterium RBG_16_53_22]
MGARGEGVIHCKNKDINLLFTNRALLSAEKQMGKGILEVSQGFIGGSSGLTELVALLRCGMEAANQEARRGSRPVSNNDALDIIDEVGFTTAIEPVMTAVAAVISYKPDEDGSAPEDDSDPN